MKNITIAIIILLSATRVFAAGSCIETRTSLYSGISLSNKYKLTMVCTSHSDNSLSTTISTATVNKLSGLYFYNITAYPGDIAPTTDTDLTITATNGNKSIDVLGGNGVDIIDNTETREEIPRLIAGAVNFFSVVDPANTYTVATINNAVASATFTLELIFVP
ncbi:hypothetical protein KAR91_33750 [Candidatus Pacearchaeota archaeon]|nr:hypothetical protein [Candidatus Pacearchaeota archaeon]